jgi:hypothetical protein
MDGCLAFIKPTVSPLAKLLDDDQCNYVDIGISTSGAAWRPWRSASGSWFGEIGNPMLDEKERDGRH